MTDPGFKGVTIKKELWEALQARYKEETRGKKAPVTFSSWVSETLWQALERRGTQAR